ncbi:MAG: excinuclease ABC subunit UvrC [Oscillospiraceae bacterium]|nr:excinuclease ABC subunit UvrC [Oscillospiraceae bacterium]
MNNRLAYLREKTSGLTSSSGVYLMKDKSGNIIYIGKAKNLKNRVSSYFRENPNHNSKTAKMVSQVYDYDFIVTDSEYEALILECSLIKQNNPKYNILLKDDKGYHYIKISKEDYPRITDEKNISDDGEYLGPYMSGFVTRETVNEVNKVFMLPTCNKKFPRDFRKGRPCLNYHIKKCMGVCMGNINKEDYNNIISQAVSYIKNGNSLSIENLEREMLSYSEKCEFEKAGIIRDRIIAIKKASEKQKIISKGVNNADIIGIVSNYDNICISVLMYRSGRLSDKSVFTVPYGGDNITGDFIKQFYHGKNDIPKALITEDIPEDYQLIEEMLSEQCGHRVKIATAEKGRLKDLLRLAKNNSAEYIAVNDSRTGREVIALEEIAKILGLSKPPHYIEAYDISNLSSASMVAGMVVFKDGKPFKKAYKRFSIKEVNIQNDYGSMQEVLRRRLSKIGNDSDEYFSRCPDLILLDGGKGHVNAVEPIIKEFNLDIPLYGMVKDSRHRTRAITTGGREIQVSGFKSAFNLLTQIQDEVHRFSVDYMHRKHNKASYKSELTNIKGIGDKKASKIMIYFKTKENLLNADINELAKAGGLSLETARELYNMLH